MVTRISKDRKFHHKKEEVQTEPEILTQNVYTDDSTYEWEPIHIENESLNDSTLVSTISGMSLIGGMEAISIPNYKKLRKEVKDEQLRILRKYRKRNRRSEPYRLYSDHL